MFLRSPALSCCKKIVLHPSGIEWRGSRSSGQLIEHQENELYNAQGSDLSLCQMKRFIGLDVVRGFLLLMMVVNHSPSSLRRFTDQPLGFFTTAECFVFVSAFLAGMLFRKRAEKLGLAAARSFSLRRAWRIYGAHLITIAFAFALGSFFLPDFPGITNLLDHYLMHPWAAIIGALALVFRPPLMDILPMYVLFSLLTPAVFSAALRWGWRPVVLTSLSTWLIAQTHVRDLLFTALKDLPFVQLGPFDLLAWQFLWVGGLFVGQRFLQDKSLLPPLRWLRPVLFFTALAFLIWRWNSIAGGPDPVTQSWLFDKWHLGPLRLTNFAVAVCVSATFLKYSNRWETRWQPFLLIARHMLPVFCSQICLSVLLLGRTESGQTVEPITSALVLCQLLTVFLFAWFLELRAVARESNGRVPPAFPSEGTLYLTETPGKTPPVPGSGVRQPVLQHS